VLPVKIESAPTRILIADDDPILVELLAQPLTDAGYEVLEAFDSASALEICIAQSPALAIIDYEMPGYSGVELARFIDSQTGVALIFVSGHAEEAVVSAAVEAGALAYLLKPVDIQQLIFTVRTALERGRDLRELRQQSNNLNKALTASRSVSVATGLIMGKLGLSQAEAYECLRQRARSNRVRLEALCCNRTKKLAFFSNPCASAQGRRLRRRARDERYFWRAIATWRHVTCAD
jgi:two-component system, response regulator PdtaR